MIGFFGARAEEASAGSRATRSVPRRSWRTFAAWWQYGQPAPLLRFATRACHTWAAFSLQRHQTALPERAKTVAGVSGPFLVGCHSLASSGCRPARDAAGEGRRGGGGHRGHPVPRARCATLALQSCARSTRQRHQTFTCEPAMTSAGRSRPFFVGCHSAARSGRLAARVLGARRHSGQPGSLLRATTRARHSWVGFRAQRHQTFRTEPHATAPGVSARPRDPLASAEWASGAGDRAPATAVCQTCCRSLEQRHHTSRFDPYETAAGVREPFLLGCHSAARAGEEARRLSSPRGAFFVGCRSAASARRAARESRCFSGRGGFVTVRANGHRAPHRRQGGEQPRSPLTNLRCPRRPGEGRP